MMIRSRMGVSADGFASTLQGVPVLAMTPGFEPGISHDYPEFIEDCDADRTFPDGSAELVYTPA
jgi:hypothetical protein